VKCETSRNGLASFAASPDDRECAGTDRAFRRLKKAEAEVAYEVIEDDETEKVMRNVKTASVQAGVTLE
jgi:hypothetical protein